MNEGPPIHPAPPVQESPKEAPPEPRKASSWDAVKRRVASGLLAGSVLMGGGMPAAEASPDMPQRTGVSEQAEGYRDKIAESNRLYGSSFETSTEGVVQAAKLFKEINNAPEFQSLSYLDRAELKHREAYARQQVIKVWFDRKYKTFSEQDAQDLRGAYDQVHALLQESIKTEMDQGELTEDRQRSLNALVTTGQLMAEQGIRLEVERPDMADSAKELKAASNDFAEEAMSIDGRLRYVDDGLFLISPGQSLLVRPGGMPEIVNDKSGAAAGFTWNVAEGLVPWANKVADGSAPATPGQRAFIDTFVRLKILVRQGTRYAPGDVEKILIAGPSEDTFTHEVAHNVEADNPAYLDVARREFAQLSETDQVLFNTFMSRGVYAGTNEKTKMREFFAYTHQSGQDWRDIARQR